MAACVDLEVHEAHVIRLRFNYLKLSTKEQVLYESATFDEAENHLHGVLLMHLRNNRKLARLRR